MDLKKTTVRTGALLAATGLLIGTVLTEILPDSLLNVVAIAFGLAALVLGRRR
jgi:Na+(H+)/acetate symporter ActP